MARSWFSLPHQDEAMDNLLARRELVEIAGVRA
jgi:hypothetical protein